MTNPTRSGRAIRNASGNGTAPGRRSRARWIAALGLAAATSAVVVIGPAHATTSTGLPSVQRSVPDLFPEGFSRPLVDVTTSAESNLFVADFVKDYETFYGSVGVNEMPIWRVPAGQPMVPVSVAPGCNDFLSDTGSEIPIPAEATATTGPDHSMVVFQWSTRTVWELWRAHNNGNGTWSACWGGRLRGVATSSGVFPAPFGLAASGISYMATTITERDVESGTIDHTLAVDLPHCDAPQVSPADRSDCATDPGAEPGQPSEGQMYRMPTTVAMPAGLTPFAQMVFRALQTHGMVVTDYAGAVMVEAEQTTDWAAEGYSGVDPITASWAGHAEYNVLQGIPWQAMQVVTP